MEPPSRAPFSANHAMRWTSPITYILGGLAILFGFLFVALLILFFCSVRVQLEPSSDAMKKPAQTNGVVEDVEPKFVVIMAGDSNPTFLAKPVPSTLHSEQVWPGLWELLRAGGLELQNNHSFWQLPWLYLLPHDS